MTAPNPKMSKDINWEAYICKGAHCKCLGNNCDNYHVGDHTCPSSTPDHKHIWRGMATVKGWEACVVCRMEQRESSTSDTPTLDEILKHLYVTGATKAQCVRAKQQILALVEGARPEKLRELIECNGCIGAGTCTCVGANNYLYNQGSDAYHSNLLKLFNADGGKTL